MSQTENTDIKKTARITGFLYLLLVPFGAFGIIYVPEFLIIDSDASATSNNFMANILNFRLSIGAALLSQIINIFVALGLYKILKSVNKNLARLMVIFTILAAAIAMLNEVNNFAILSLLSGADYLSAFAKEQQQALVLMFHHIHQYGVAIASIFWGLWLLPMGLLIFKSTFLPKTIGVFLVIACFGYLADFLILVFSPNLDLVLSEFTFLGELMLLLWLLVKGVDEKQWHLQA